jgi:hypothetical protein
MYFFEQTHAPRLLHEKKKERGRVAILAGSRKKLQ